MKEDELMKLNFWRAEEYQWVLTDTPHIWLCQNTGKYHFGTEDEQIDGAGYDTVEQCNVQLDKYCAWLSQEQDRDRKYS